MKTTLLEFEQPITEFETKIEELRFIRDDFAVSISEETSRLASKSQQLTKDLYASLTPWQVTQIARHPQRPYTLDYVRGIFTDFHELHGDRTFTDDLSIVGGLAHFNGQAYIVIGHQKGRDTEGHAPRNFGMSEPRDYRKTKRLMELTSKSGLPIFMFVDTPGAFPGVDTEERGRSEAIGHNLFVMAGLKVSLIAAIIDKGSSDGALIIAIGDSMVMLQFAIYAVISSEGCASILWKTIEKTPEAAEALGLAAHRLKALGLIGKIVNESLGGTHRDPKSMTTMFKRALAESLRQFQGMKTSELQARRHEHLMVYDKFKETKSR